MNRYVVLFVSVAAVLALLVFILWDVFHTVPEVPAGPIEVPEVPVQKSSTVSLPVARRELSVSGRVVGPSLEALLGVRVVCGDESVTTDSDGVFSFPKAVRPRIATVRVCRGGEDVCIWDGVLVGDPLPPGGDGPAPGEESLPDYSLDATIVPALPEKLRWTINTGNTVRAELAAPGSSVNAGKGALENQPWIQLDEAIFEEWGNGVRTRVRGRTRLPDDAHVALSLYFDGLRTIATLEPAVVKSSAFAAAMYSPADMRFYSGVFEVRASFNSVLESYSAMEEWKQFHPQVDWESLTVPEGTRSVFCGNPVEARGEDLAAGAYYARTYETARRLERSMKSALLRRSDEIHIFVEGKGLGPKSLRSGVRAWFRDDLLDSQDRLDEPKWRKFLDEEWRPEIRALVKEHSTRGQEKYMTASTLVNGLLDALLDESYGFSKFVVYPAFNLEPHPNDFYADEERAGDLVRLERVVQSCFEGLERFRHLAE